MILERANELLERPANNVTYCKKMPLHPDDCKYKDFRNLSSMTDISISTLTRLFKHDATATCLGKLHTLTQEKIVQFLGCEDWLTLEKIVFEKNDRDKRLVSITFLNIARGYQCLPITFRISSCTRPLATISRPKM